MVAGEINEIFLTKHSFIEIEKKNQNKEPD